MGGRYLFVFCLFVLLPFHTGLNGVGELFLSQ